MPQGVSQVGASKRPTGKIFDDFNRADRERLLHKTGDRTFFDYNDRVRTPGNFIDVNGGKPFRTIPTALKATTQLHTHTARRIIEQLCIGTQYSQHGYSARQRSSQQRTDVEPFSHNPSGRSRE